jgi:hypothetical protein
LYKAAALIATEGFAVKLDFQAMVVTSVAKVVWQHRWDCREGLTQGRS